MNQPVEVVRFDVQRSLVEVLDTQDDQYYDNTDQKILDASAWMTRTVKP